MTELFNEQLPFYRDPCPYCGKPHLDYACDAQVRHAQSEIDKQKKGTRKSDEPSYWITVLAYVFIIVGLLMIISNFWLRWDGFTQTGAIILGFGGILLLIAWAVEEKGRGKI